MNKRLSQKKQTAITDDELEILGDSRFLLKKRRISEKLVLQLYELQAKIALLKDQSIWRQEKWPSGSKVYKGENYHSLPYLAMDFPSSFQSKNDYFTFRTMIWWGKYIHCFALAAGSYKKIVTDEIPFMSTSPEDLYLGTSESPWSYRLEQDYMKAEEKQANKLIQEDKKWIKAGTFLDIRQINRMESFVLRSFKTLCFPRH